MPRQCNTREENEAIKRGQTPEDWEKTIAQRQRQKKVGSKRRLGREGESEKEPSSRSRRARVRRSADLTGRPDSADDRNRQSASKDRIAEPRLQHPSPRDARTDGRRMKWSPSGAPRSGTPGGR